MANIPYHKLATGEYMNLNEPGGPDYFRVQGIQQPDLSTLYFPQFSYDGGNSWFTIGNGNNTVALAQAALDTFMTNVNNGTVSS